MVRWTRIHLLDASGGNDLGEKAVIIIESIQIKSRGLSRYSDKLHAPAQIKNSTAPIVPPIEAREITTEEA
jgi:hypothetical protein